MKSSNLTSSIVSKLRENTLGQDGTPHFDLSNLYLGPEKIAEVGNCIKHNGINSEGFAPIISLDLSSNLVCGIDQLLRGSVDTSGFHDFCNCLIALNKNSRLRKLSLNRNYLESAGCAVLSNFLTVGPSSLLELSCKGCSINHEGMEKLAEGVKNSKSLQILDIRDNELCPESGKFIADMLTSNVKTKHLTLNNCMLGPEGCSTIFHSLGHNTSLEVLNISCNGCGNNAMDALQASLKINQRLKALDIQENGIGLEGINSLCKGLAKNRILSHLGLQWNDLTNECTEKIAEVLSQNSTLRDIHVLGNYIDEQGVKTLIEGSLRGCTTAIEVDIAFHFRPASRAKRKNLPQQEASTASEEFFPPNPLGEEEEDKEDGVGLRNELSLLTDDTCEED